MSIGIVERALNSLGKGFDLTSDFKLKYCKGKERLVLLNETHRKDINLPGFGPIKDVSIDVKCDKGDRTRYQSDILEFNQVFFFSFFFCFISLCQLYISPSSSSSSSSFVQMSEFFNQKNSVPGKIPSGYFNAMFNLESDSWATDAANTKYLGLDGYFITLFNLHIDRYPLLLSDEVRNAVPSSWDPGALSR